MPAYARHEIVADDHVGVYHCITRCVRRAYLCGVDLVSGKNHDHRKQWIRERLQTLASVFGIEVCGYAVMSNHLHAILRVRPDLAQAWTDDEVALRWRRLFPVRDQTTGQPTEPQEHDLAMITSDPGRVAELRGRLASLSWFMRCLNEPIARAANREDQCKGRFWEGRFKSQALLDEAAILACSVYVDLNPIRAGVADTPEASEFTSAFDRIRSLQTVVADSAKTGAPVLEDPAPGDSTVGIATREEERPDAWLCELTLREGPSAEPIAIEAKDQDASPVASNDNESQPGSGGSRPELAARASNQGYLPIEIEKYLSLLDWTGRELRSDKRGTIPGQLSPILERLGVSSVGWVETVRHFGRWFKRAVGRHDSMAAIAMRSGRCWFQGLCAVRVAFR